MILFAFPNAGILFLNTTARVYFQEIIGLRTDILREINSDTGITQAISLYTLMTDNLNLVNQITKEINTKNIVTKTLGLEALLNG